MIACAGTCVYTCIRGQTSVSDVFLKRFPYRPFQHRIHFLTGGVSLKLDITDKEIPAGQQAASILLSLPNTVLAVCMHASLAGLYISAEYLHILPTALSCQLLSSRHRSMFLPCLANRDVLVPRRSSEASQGARLLNLYFN